MSEYFILYDKSGKLDIERCAKAVDSITKLLLFKGLCMYLPAPNSPPGTVILFVAGRDAADSETEWFLRTLCGYLSCGITDSEGNSVFADSDDNDPTFLDFLPAPENEAHPIRLFFYIDGVSGNDVYEKIASFFERNEYEINEETDGYSVYICANSYLDIFYLQSEGRITGDIDLSVSGAGVYAEVTELAEAFAAALDGTVTFMEDPAFTYTADRDFDKLRKSFYLPIAQQLAFASADDREGIQGYIGWGTDAFEPEYIKGSVATPFGRYDLEKLRLDIAAYGFSYVCDTRFLSRNTPTDGSDFYIKEALNLIWNSTFGGKDKDLNSTEMLGVNQSIRDLEYAIEADSNAPFPKALYSRLCAISGHTEADYSRCSEYELHYEPGYFRGTVFYGFGHYLRRFRAPNGFSREEMHHGEDVFFFGSRESAFKIDVEISYDYHGDGSESMLGSNFAKGSASDIETFDIGGSSVVRFLDGGFMRNRYVAEAEVFIADEVYRFAAASKSYDDILTLRDILKGCISVEDWYDEYIRDEFPDPHANGATFCINGEPGDCAVFMKPFPIDPGCLLSDAVSAEELVSEAAGISLDVGAAPPSVEDVILAIVERLKKQDEEDAKEENSDDGNTGGE